MIISTKQSCRTTAWLGIILLSSPFSSFQSNNDNNNNNNHSMGMGIGIGFVESTLDPELLFDSIDGDGFKGGVYQERENANTFNFDELEDDDDDDTYEFYAEEEKKERTVHAMGRY